MPAPHIERMLVEGDELAEKIEKLKAFILGGNPVYAGLSESDQALLQAQLSVMTCYLNILNLRLLHSQ